MFHQNLFWILVDIEKVDKNSGNYKISPVNIISVGTVVSSKFAERHQFQIYFILQLSGPLSEVCKKETTEFNF